MLDSPNQTITPNIHPSVANDTTQRCDAVGLDLVQGVVELAREAALTTKLGGSGSGAGDGSSGERVVVAGEAGEEREGRKEVTTPVYLQADMFALPPTLSYQSAAAAAALETAGSSAAAAAGSAEGAGSGEAGASSTGFGTFDLVFDSQCFHCLREHDERRAVLAIASLLRPGGLLLVLTGNSEEPEVGPAVLSREELEVGREEVCFVCSSSSTGFVIACGLNVVCTCMLADVRRLFSCNDFCG